MEGEPLQLRGKGLEKTTKERLLSEGKKERKKGRGNCPHLMTKTMNLPIREATGIAVI